MYGLKEKKNAKNQQKNILFLQNSDLGAKYE